MKFKQLIGCLLLIMALSTSWSTSATASLSSTDCILLTEGSTTFLDTYADGMHALIDLLPAERALGLMVAGQANSMLPPARLSRGRRAQLHAFIEQAHATSHEVNEIEWEIMLRAAMGHLTSAGKGSGTVILLRAETELPANWPGWLQTAAANGVRLYEVDLSVPLSRETGMLEQRQPGPLAHGGLARLPELLGLVAGELTSLAFNEAGLQLAVKVPAGVQSLILQWDGQISLTTPTGHTIDLQAEPFQAQLFAGPGYTCLHLNPELLPEVVDWQGQWTISAAGSMGVGVWFNDPAWLQANVVERGGQRLICLATNMSAGNLPVVILQDLSGKALVQLNDLGINGDAVANDGVYSAWLPSFVAAGPAILHVSGDKERSLAINIPAPVMPVDLPFVETPEKIPPNKLFLIGLMVVGSGLGMLLLLGKKKEEPLWRISHQRVDGHWHCYDLVSPALTAGSGDICQIRLARTAAVQQLRIKQSKDGVLRLDVLSPEPAVCVNDKQVYLTRQLQHGDRITIGGEILITEQLKHLRVGREKRSG
ncbi:MAG: hypothetical protein GX033_07290 [Firmicutes bacterium]|nr:hypothetical protein [Bacillota bacterium]